MTDADTNSREPMTSEWSELAVRENDGLVVSLRWNPSTNGTRITVADAKSDDVFDFGVTGSDALSAFHHPFAYAPSGALVQAAIGRSINRPVAERSEK
jgi:hypothetical protein